MLSPCGVSTCSALGAMCAGAWIMTQADNSYQIGLDCFLE